MYALSTLSYKSPDVAVLTIEEAAGRDVEVLVDNVVRTELFDLLRRGYPQAPAPLATSAEVLVATKDMLGLSGERARNIPMRPPATLPNPPLSEDQKHDRILWADAQAEGALLLTNDHHDLISAVWQQTGSSHGAILPIELKQLVGAIRRGGV